MSRSVNFLILSVFLCLSAVRCSNILFVSCVISPSHFIYNKALAEELAARGHNITFVSADKEENPPDNIHYVHLENLYSHFLNNSEFKEAEGEDPMEFIKMPDLLVVVLLYEFGGMLCEASAQSNGFKAINNYPADFKFDLIIYDYSFSPCLLGLVHKFNYPPLIGISAFNNPSYTVDILGGSDKLGLTVKPYYLFSYDKDMKIHQRFYNGFINFIDSFYRKYIAMPKYDKYVKEMFGSDTPYVGDIEKTMSLALVNSHPSIDYAESLPPNVIEVGGLQIREKAEMLDNDIHEFLMSGKKGSILMSFGTNFRSDEMGEERFKIFLDTFRQLPDYNFLWKFETAEKLVDVPPNVMIKAWLPQSDILAHESIKAFISHVGLLSTHEATYHAVPIVGIPIFVDQHRNLHKAITAGVAVKVDFMSLSVETFKNAIIEIVSNPRYKRNMEVRSKLFRDQKEKPLDRAIWWCEYFIRNGKVNHLNQTEFGSHFWDIQFILLILLFISIWFLMRIFKRFCKRSKKVNQIKKNN